MLTVKQLDDMSKINMAEIDRNSLVDISSVCVDTALPAAEKMTSYLQQIKNPYLFRCGNIVIRVRFSPNGADLGDLLKRHFLTLKRDAESRKP